MVEIDIDHRVAPERKIDIYGGRGAAHKYKLGLKPRLYFDVEQRDAAYCDHIHRATRDR